MKPAGVDNSMHLPLLRVYRLVSCWAKVNQLVQHDGRPLKSCLATGELRGRWRAAQRGLLLLNITISHSTESTATRLIYLFLFVYFFLN